MSRTKSGHPKEFFAFGPHEKWGFTWSELLSSHFLHSPNVKNSFAQPDFTFKKTFKVI